MLLLVLSNSMVAQTASDPCSFGAASQYPVNYTCQYSTFDKPSSFVANLNPGTCGSGNYDDAFGWFTAIATTTTITFDPDGFVNPIMHLYSGTCAALTYLACSNDNGNGGNETITFATTIGTNYLIRIQRSGTNNSMDGRLCIWSPPPPPVNDDCGAAIDLFVFETCFMQTFTNLGATASGVSPGPTCSSAPNTDVWFRFVAPASGAVRIFSETGSLTDGAMQLYTGSCGALSLVPGGCDDDTGVPPNANMPYLDYRCAPLSGGTTYYIRYWGYNSSSGTFGLCVYGPDVFPTPIQDCSGGFTVCNSGAINNASDWRGCSADLGSSNRGCLLNNERQGTWYYFSPQTTGNLGFTLQPTNQMGQPTNIDYDFAIWGPMSTITCPPVGSPIRCSYAYPPTAGTWLTGMATGNSDVSEAASGTGVNGFVAPINVGAGDVGQIYVMFIDNFDQDGQSFNLNWNLATPDQLDCTLLPIAIIDLDAVQQNDHVSVQWTAQEVAQHDRFIVERSTDGSKFDPIGTLQARPTNGGISYHQLDDAHPETGMNYYRVIAVAHDGAYSTSHVAKIHFRRTTQALIILPNPASDRIHLLGAEATMEEVAEIRLHDGSGRMVRHRLHSKDGGPVRFPIGDLDAGYYTVVLLDGTGSPLGTGRFMKE
ncbi:MAG: hypothetical protein KDB95_07915 [Flavobacteriales bacterium]|nr:hypothetical protein [Flavobacteriales bacterium]